MITKDLETRLINHFSKQGQYLTLEMKVPIYDYDDWSHAFDGNERVDVCMIWKGSWYFFELKVTVADFRSKAKKSFQGNYNYFVMPKEIYEKVKDEIKAKYPGVGCYVYNDTMYELQCVMPAKRQDLKVKEENLKIAFVRSLSCQFLKYRYRYDSQRTSIRQKLLAKIDDLQRNCEDANAHLDYMRDCVEKI